MGSKKVMGHKDWTHRGGRKNWRWSNGGILSELNGGVGGCDRFVNSNKSPTMCLSFRISCWQISSIEQVQSLSCFLCVLTCKSTFHARVGGYDSMHLFVSGVLYMAAELTTRGVPMPALLQVLVQSFLIPGTDTGIKTWFSGVSENEVYEFHV